MLHTPAFEALFAILQSEQHTPSILQENHLPVLDLELCMQHLKGQLAAQMTAGACLCQLVFLELREAPHSHTEYAYCDMLLSFKGFKAMMQSLEAGIQVRPCTYC